MQTALGSPQQLTMGKHCAFQSSLRAPVALEYDIERPGLKSELKDFASQASARGVAKCASKYYYQ